MSVSEVIEANRPAQRARQKFTHQVSHICKSADTTHPAKNKAKEARKTADATGKTEANIPRYRGEAAKVYVIGIFS